MNTITNTTEYMDLHGVVSLLGVSSATVRNWIKHSYLIPKETSGKKMLFNSTEVKELKQKIVSGEVNRLNRRANKKNSQNTFIPDEYADNDQVLKMVQEIISVYKSEKLERNTTLLFVAINLLKNKGLVEYKKLSDFNDLVFKSNAIKNEVKWWLEKSNAKIPEKK
ncbi:MAG TPA: hypothetical protein VI752_02915, partial [Candidatus Paceibacterota bacterium]